MKTQGKSLMIRITISLLFCVVIVFCSFQVYAQEWTDEQKEVWKTAKSFFEYIAQGDLEGISALLGEDSLSWLSNQAVPWGHEPMIQLYEGWFEYETISYELYPRNIHIVGDVAVLFYVWKWKGTKTSGSERIMDVYTKRDNKWRYVASMGCSCEELVLCE